MMAIYLGLSFALLEASREDTRDNRLNSFGTISPLGDTAKAKEKATNQWENLEENRYLITCFTHTCRHTHARAPPTSVAVYGYLNRKRTLPVSICLCRNRQFLDTNWPLAFSCLLPQGNCRETAVTERAFPDQGVEVSSCDCGACESYVATQL